MRRRKLVLSEPERWAFFRWGNFFSEGGLTVTGYYNQHREAAQAAADFTESRGFDSAEAVAESSDAIFLTVPDNQIREVYGASVGWTSGAKNLSLQRGFVRRGGLSGH